MRFPNWFDMLLYRLFRWRWNPIFSSNSAIREVVIGCIRSAELIAAAENIQVTVTIEETAGEENGE